MPRFLLGISRDVCDTVSRFSKIQIGFTFQVPAHRLTWVVLEKGPLNGCVCVSTSSCCSLGNDYTTQPFQTV